MLQDLERIFPRRSIAVPVDTKASVASASASAKRKRAEEPDTRCAQSGPKGDDDTLRENLALDDEPSEARRGAAHATPGKRTCFGFPKGHACLHHRETLRLYGSLAEVSAEPTERRHVSLKAAFLNVEPGPRAAQQACHCILCRAGVGGWWDVGLSLCVQHAIVRRRQLYNASVYCLLYTGCQLVNPCFHIMPGHSL